MPNARRIARRWRQPDIARTWYSCRDLHTWNDDLANVARTLIDAARDGQWDTVFRTLDADNTNDLVNVWRPGGTAEYTALHHAARLGHRRAALRLLARGAWRCMPNANGETPADVARRHGHDALAASIAPLDDLRYVKSQLPALQHWFTALVRARLSHDRTLWQSLRLPELVVVVESAPQQVYFPVPGLGGGFLLRYRTERDLPHGAPVITVDSWSRMSSGSEQTHRITELECRREPAA